MTFFFIKTKFKIVIELKTLNEEITIKMFQFHKNGFQNPRKKKNKSEAKKVDLFAVKVKLCHQN